MSIERPERTKMNKETLILMGIPKKFCSQSIDDYEADSESLNSVKDYVQNYIENIPNVFEINEGILFVGDNGTGKTMLSSFILIEAYRLRYSIRRVKFSDYISLYTRAWSKNPAEKEEAEDDFNTNYKTVEFLVIDEVGKEIDSKIGVPILEDCLRYREERGYPTIICTNCDIETLEERYGKSVMSLLRGNTTLLQIQEKDRRGEYYDKRKE